MPGVSIAAQGGEAGGFSASLSKARQQQQDIKKQELRQLLGQEGYSALGAGKLLDKHWKPWRFDVWAEGRYAYFKDDDSADAKGHFGVFYLGADYVVNPWLLVGGLVQYDDMKETSNSETTRIHGRGWMIGPYATVKLSDNLYLQSRAAWGKSKNDISPFRTYTDTFDTTRWLVRSKLKGVWNFGALRFSPSMSIAYIEEHQKSYVDTLGVLIPSQKVSLGQAEFGPEFSYTFKTSSGTTIVPSLGLKGIWNFAEDNGVLVGGTTVGAGEFRGKLDLGLKILSKEGLALELGGSYDGIGDHEYESYSGTVKLRVPF